MIYVFFTRRADFYSSPSVSTARGALVKYPDEMTV